MVLPRTHRVPLDLKNIDFFELLATTANDMKGSLVASLVTLAGEGDPAALRILEKALVKKEDDEGSQPIPILGGITQVNAIQTNNSAVPHLSAKQTP